jgi:nitroreductase
MDITTAIRSRKSIRGFKPDPVPDEALREILKVATRAPSATNTQPWQITVVTGKALDAIRKGNLEVIASGKAGDPGRRLEGKYRERQIELGKQLFNLMGIPREDKEKRSEWQKRGFCFFDAPTALILATDESLGGRIPFFDCGALAQSICLAALSFGLGTCIAGQGIRFPEVVRRITGIPPSQQLVIGIAIGYPDEDFPANRLVSRREPIDSIVSWCHNPQTSPIHRQLPGLL